MILRKMKNDNDISGKAYVHFKSWHETYSDLVDAEFLKTITLEKCEEIAHRRTDNIIVAVEDEKIIGFVGYGAYRGIDLLKYGEIYAIYVLRNFHSRKIGYELMNAAFEQLVEYKKIAVWVLRGNDRAINFYEKYGFRFDGAEQEITLGTTVVEQRMIYERG